MGLLDRFKKKDVKEEETKKGSQVKVEPKKQDEKKKEKKESEYKTLKTKGDDKAILDKKEKSGKTVKTKSSNTKDAYKILIRPLITEKATNMAALNKYCFEVSKRANKIQIKDAIRSLYNVEPIEVNIVINRGKAVRYGRVTGKKKSWKKAIVTLKQGDKIQLYEGV